MPAAGRSRRATWKDGTRRERRQLNVAAGDAWSAKGRGWIDVGAERGRAGELEACVVAAERKGKARRRSGSERKQRAGGGREAVQKRRRRARGDKRRGWKGRKLKRMGEKRKRESLGKTLVQSGGKFWEEVEWAMVVKESRRRPDSVPVSVSVSLCLSLLSLSLALCHPQLGATTVEHKRPSCHSRALSLSPSLSRFHFHSLSLSLTLAHSPFTPPARPAMTRDSRSKQLPEQRSKQPH